MNFWRQNYWFVAKIVALSLARGFSGSFLVETAYNGHVAVLCTVHALLASS
jgi:hypothetical protein